MKFKVLKTAAHALWDYVDVENPTECRMRMAAESYAGRFHGLNDCTIVEYGQCAFTGEEGDLIEVEFEPTKGEKQ